MLGHLLSEQCDKVLLDAPCSGEGMQYKSDFKIYQWNEKQVKKLAYLQKELLIAGLQCLKVGGELVYSTCTTNVLENEGVIARILEELGEYVELVNVEIAEKSTGILLPHHEFLAPYVARFRPHLHHTGGFFIAKLKKVQPIPHPQMHTMFTPYPHTVIKKEKIEQFLKKTIPNPNLSFLQTKHTIRAVSKEAIRFLDTLYLDQVGLPIFKVLTTGERKALEGLQILLKTTV
jgi:hypothetical protein